jgi:hypothetical protein
LEQEQVEKRLAGLVLEAHRDLRFEGNPTEVAYQFARAVTAIKDNLETVGLEGIDYTALAQANPDDGPSAQPDARYAYYQRQLSDLERIATRAFANVDDRKLVVWSCMRLDFYVEHDPDTGFISHVPMTCRQAARHYQTLYGEPIGKSTAARWAKQLDKQLDKTLREQGWTV